MKFSFEKILKIWHTKWLFGGILAFVSAVFALILSVFPMFENFEFDTYDSRFGLRGQQETKQDDIVIVAIDDQSLISLNSKWPFPRSLFAKAILNLSDAGAKLIVVDVEFTESDRYDSKQDIVLAAAINRARNVILAGSVKTFYGNNNTAVPLIMPPIKPLLNAGASWGLVSVPEDNDGFMRRYMLYQQHNNRKYYPLSILTYVLARGGQNGTLNVEESENYFTLGQRDIPKKDRNSMLINFRGPAGTFSTYSFADILDDAEFDLKDDDTDIFELYMAEEVFKDKIVFIGASAEELQDNKFTPFFNYKGITRKLPGVELHANALSTILRGDFIRMQNVWFGIFMVFLLSALSMIFTKWLKPFKGLFVVMGLMLFYIIISIYAFINELIWIEITAPMLAIVISYGGNVLHQTLTEQRERVRIKKSWEQYMSKNVIEDMLETGNLPEFGGERRELTVLFSDIRSFTTFSEKHTPDEVVKKLNEYLTEMVDVIFQNQGTLDKFVGDEIMAIYGAPHFYKNHAEKACITAVEMMKRLAQLQKRWSAQNEDYFHIGIGINSGKMILGNLGSLQLFDYTVIGDDVNLGARLEGANKQYGTSIIISETTYKSVRKKAVVRELDLVRVKGKKKPVKIYELLDMKKLHSIEQELCVDVYTNALTLYKDYKWYQAITEFKRILRYFPTDGPTRLYIKRCLDFIENPPPENWDGVYEFKTK